MAKNLILNMDDLPSANDMRHSISRLRKCSTLLKRIKGTNDIEDPESLIKTASFLELLIKRGGKDLKRDKAFSDEIDVAIDYVATHLSQLEEWELKRTLEETKLGKILEKASEAKSDTD